MIPASRARSIPGSVWPRWTPQPSSSAAWRSSLTTSSTSRSCKERPSSTTCAVGAPFRRSCTTVAPPAAAARAVVSSATIACSFTDSRAVAERAWIERGQSVVEGDVEAARAFGLDGGVLARDAEGDQRLDGSLEAIVLAGEEAAGQRGRHAARPRDRREQLVTVRDRRVSLTVRDVVDGSGDRGDDAERPRRLLGELGRIAATADRLDPAHLGVDADERRDLACVAAQDGDVDVVEDSLRRARPVGGRPRADGSRTTGIPRSFAATPASNIASIQSSESVPMLSTSAPARPTISTTSSFACAITGSAPSARIAFAVSFMTT